MERIPPVAIEIEHLSHTYQGASKPALSDISARFDAGVVYGIFGPNGSGKTTFFNRILGEFTGPGILRIDSVESKKYSRRHRARLLAAVEQNIPASLPFTIRRTVALGRYPWQPFFSPGTPEENDPALDRALELMGLAAMENRPYNELSGGVKQRVMIARALAQDTKYLLFDEPSSNLDIEHRIEFYKLARELARQGKGILIACHDLFLAPRFLDQALLLSEGVLLASGPVSAVMTTENLYQTFHCPLIPKNDGTSLSIQLE